MIPKSLLQWLEIAQKEHWAIPVSVVKNISGALAVMEHSSKNARPLMIEVVFPKAGLLLDRGELKVDAEIESSSAPIFLACANIKKESDATPAINAGYDIIHWDGHGADYHKTIKIVRRIVKYVHKHHAYVEVSLGLRGTMTNPEQAARFARETLCDVVDVEVFGKGKKTDTALLKNLHRLIPCFLAVRSSPEDARTHTLLCKYGIVKIV